MYISSSSNNSWLLLWSLWFSFKMHSLLVVMKRNTKELDAAFVPVPLWTWLGVHHWPMTSRSNTTLICGNRCDMVLEEVHDVIVQLLHVGELRQEEGVPPPQPLVVLRQSREEVGVSTCCSRRRLNPTARFIWKVMWRRRVIQELVLQVVVALRGLRGLPSVDIWEQMLTPFPKELIRKLPPICSYLSESLQWCQQKAYQIYSIRNQHFLQVPR